MSRQCSHIYSSVSSTALRLAMLKLRAVRNFSYSSVIVQSRKSAPSSECNKSRYRLIIHLDNKEKHSWLLKVYRPSIRASLTLTFKQDTEQSKLLRQMLYWISWKYLLNDLGYYLFRLILSHQLLLVAT